MTRQTEIALVGLCLALAGCLPPLDSDGQQALAIARMPAEEAQRAINKLSPDKQVDVYLAGGTQVEPPLMLQGYLAPNWRAVLPVVKARLASASSARVFELSNLLLIISQNFCSLAERDDVLSAVSAAGPRAGPYRTSVEEDLKKILQPAKKLPTCQ